MPETRISNSIHRRITSRFTHYSDHWTPKYRKMVISSCRRKQNRKTIEKISVLLRKKNVDNKHEIGTTKKERCWTGPGISKINMVNTVEASNYYRMHNASLRIFWWQTSPKPRPRCHHRGWVATYSKYLIHICIQKYFLDQHQQIWKRPIDQYATRSWQH